MVATCGEYCLNIKSSVFLLTDLIIHFVFYCRSHIYNMFDIVMQSTVKCRSCCHTNKFAENFVTLPLDVKVC